MSPNQKCHYQNTEGLYSNTQLQLQEASTESRIMFFTSDTKFLACFCVSCYSAMFL